MRSIRDHLQECDALGDSSLVVLRSQTIWRRHQLTHVPELDVLLCVNLDSFDIGLEVAVGLEDAGTLFPFELQNAGRFQHDLSLLRRPAIIKVNSVCQAETRAETQQEGEAKGFHGAGTDKSADRPIVEQNARTWPTNSFPKVLMLCALTQSYGVYAQGGGYD